MGFIAALLSKTGQDVSSHIMRMLDIASPSRGDGYGVGTPEGVGIFSSLPETLAFKSDLMLGYNLSKIMPNDPPQPVNQHGHTMVFEGRLWDRKTSSIFSDVADVVGTDPIQGIWRLIKEKNGSYAITAIEKGRILCGRDPVGIVPLYLGENKTVAGVSSNRKMLWTVGIEPEPLPPGCMAEITKNGISLQQICVLRQPPVRTQTTEQALEMLDRLLIEAVEARSRGVFRASLGFSGGIDSTLLAHYLDHCGVEVDLICVGMEDSEFEAAEEAAESLGLPIRLESFTPSEMERDLEAVLRSIEEPDTMKASIALPLYWAAKMAIESGSRVLYSGNGSDELFGGYMKYIHEYAKSGEAARDAMFRDVKASHEVNYERDFKVCADMGVELRLPFADWNLIDFGLALPVHLKLSADEKSPRKLLLRKLGSRNGLNDAISFRPKRAVQYSTGVTKALKQLTRRNGTMPSQYLKQKFDLIKIEYWE